MLRNIRTLKNRASWRYTVVVLMSVVLSAALLGCVVATEPLVAQEVPDVEVAVPITPEVPEEAEADPPEQDVGVVAVNDAENTEDEFVPDWDAITQRADELVEFFTANLVDGITIEDVIDEFGREPAEYYYDYYNDGYSYRFDLITGPSYIPFTNISHEGMGTPEGHIDWEWLHTGYIGIRVRIIILENESTVRHIQVERGDPNMDRWHIISISALNNEVIVNVSTHYLHSTNTGALCPGILQ